MATDIEKKGNGSWYMIHLICSDATNIEKAIYVIELIKKKFFCNKCKKHFNEFCELNNPKKAAKEYLGLFYWSVDAHNNVNKMNNKDIMSHEKAYDLWFGVGGMCSEDCDEEVEFQKNIVPPSIIGNRLPTPPRTPFTMDKMFNKPASFQQ